MSSSKIIRFEILADSGPLDITPNVLKFYLRHSLLSHGRVWELKIQTLSWRMWEKHLIGKDPLKFRVSTDTGETTGWLDLYVDVSKSDYRRNRLIAVLRGGDALLKTATTARTRAFPSMSVNAVVQKICADYGFVPRVDSMQGTKTWYQIQETDYAYLKHVLGYAATVAGRGDVWLWFDNGTLNMRTINFLAKADRSYILGGIDDRVYSAPALFRGGPIDRSGGRRWQITSYDPLKRMLSVKATSAANAAGGPSLGPYVPRQETGGMLSDPIADPDPFIADAVAKARWGKHGPAYFGIKTRVVGDLSLVVGTMIEVDFQKEDMRETAFIRGKYPIFVVEHQYAKGLLYTNVHCFRREANYGEEPSTGANAAATAGTDAYLSGLANRTEPVPTTTITARPMA